MNIKIIECTEKETKFGKPMKALKVEAEGETRVVNMFNNFPDFANLKVGSVFLANMAREGNYWNLSYEGADKLKGNSGYKQKVIEETMARKEKSISGFQDNKEFSIMIASSMRGAIDLALAEWKDETVLDTLEQSIKKWRHWILDNWSVDPKDIQTF